MYGSPSVIQGVQLRAGIPQSTAAMPKSEIQTPVQTGSILEVSPGTLIPVQLGNEIVHVPIQPIPTNDNKIDNLIRELEEERKKNKKFKDTINQLKKTYNNEIEKYNNDMNKLKKKNKELEKLLAEKNKEIDDYIFKLSNSSKSEQITSFNPGDKIMVVLFMTQGSNDILNYAMACKSKDLFIRLEEKLYNDFPKYRNYETFYMVNARRIFRFKTLEENNIKNNDIISLFVNE